MPSRNPGEVAADHVTIDNFCGGSGGSGSDGTDCIAVGTDDPASLIDALGRATELAGVDYDGSGDTSVVKKFLPTGSQVLRDPPYWIVCGTNPDEIRSTLLQKVQDLNGRKKVVMTDWLACCDTVASLSSWLDALLDAGAAVTALQSDVVLTPGESIDSTAVTTLLGEISTASLNTQDATPPDYLRRDWSGRVPTGCEVVGGDLVPSGDYGEVRETLLEVIADDGLSRRQAADRIGCSPRTVTRILEDTKRRELYRLPAASAGE